MDGEVFVVYVDMVADLFHAGHIAFLSKARALAETRAGDRHVRLVVGLMADDEAAVYKRRPLMTLAERATVVAACRYVDDVVAPCPSPVTAVFLDRQRVDLVVHGDDLDAAGVNRWYSAAVHRGCFATVRYSRDVGTPSTTAILDRLRDRAG